MKKNISVQREDLAGTVTLIAKSGEIIHLEKNGYQDIEKNIPMDVNTIFRLYSMTKPIVSVALMMFYEQGLFKLDHPVKKYIPEFSDTKVLKKNGEFEIPNKDITIEDILSHSSGLTYGDSGNEFLDDLYNKANLFNEDSNLKEMVERIAKLPLFFHPGEGWHYGVSSNVVARLVEIFSNQSIGSYIDEKILKPLKMIDTAYFVPQEKLDRFSQLYGLDKDRKLIETEDMAGRKFTKKVRLEPGGYGLVGTIMDYYNFSQMLLNNGLFNNIRILEPETVSLMSTNVVKSSSFPINYNGLVNSDRFGLGFGLGFRVTMDIEKAGLPGSDGSYGWAGMANTVFWVDPKEKLIAILMSQCQTDEVHPVRESFLNMVYDYIAN